MTDSPIVLLSDLQAQFREEQARLEAIVNDGRDNEQERANNYNAVFRRLYDLESAIALREGRSPDPARIFVRGDESRIVCTSNKGVRVA